MRTDLARAGAATVVTLAARGSQLILFVMLARWFGVSAASDAAFLAYAKVAVIIAIVNSATEPVIVPLWIGCAGDRVAEARLLARTRRVAVALVAVGLLASVALLVPGGADPVQLLLPVAALGICSAFASALVVARVGPAQGVASPLAGALLALPLAFAFRASAFALPLALLAFEVGRVAYLAWMLARAAPAPARAAVAGNPDSAATMRAAAALALGGVAMAFVPLLAALAARRYGEGSVSIVEYSARLWNAVPVLFSGMLSVALVRFSTKVRDGTSPVAEAWRLAALAFVTALGCAATLVAVAPALLSLLLGADAVAGSHGETLVSVFRAYVLAAPAFVAGMVLVRLMNAVRRNLVVGLVGCANLATFALCVELLRERGVVAIGLAHAAMYAGALAILVVAAWRVGKPAPAAAAPVALRSGAPGSGSEKDAM